MWWWQFSRYYYIHVRITSHHVGFGNCTRTTVIRRRLRVSKLALLRFHINNPFNYRLGTCTRLVVVLSRNSSWPVTSLFLAIRVTLLLFAAGHRLLAFCPCSLCIYIVCRGWWSCRNDHWFRCTIRYALNGTGGYQWEWAATTTTTTDILSIARRNGFSIRFNVNNK